MPQKEVSQWSQPLVEPVMESANCTAEYFVEPEKQLVVVRFGKMLTAKEIERYIGQLRAHPGFAPWFSEILDLSAVEEIELRGEEMMRLADKVDPFSPDSKRAFVIHNAFQAHQARMYQIVRNSRKKIQAFHSVDEAQRWILDDESPEG